MSLLLQSDAIETVGDHFASPFGGRGIEHARRIGRQTITAMVAGAGLRRRTDSQLVARLCAEASEIHDVDTVVCVAGPPDVGSLRDQVLLTEAPFQLIEGLLIAMHQCNVRRGRIELDETLQAHRPRLAAAIAEMVASSPAAHAVTVEVSPSAATSAAAEGPVAELRLDPETLCALPPILAFGAGRYRAFGTKHTPGTTIITVSGDVRRGGVAEVEYGTTVSHLLAVLGGACRADRTIKALVVGGGQPVVTGDDLDVELSFEGLAEVGSGLGGGGLVALDDHRCAVSIAAELAGHLAERFPSGCSRCEAVAAALREAVVARVFADDLDRIASALRDPAHLASCVTAADAERSVTSLMQGFPGDFVRHTSPQGCTLSHERVLSPAARTGSDSATNAAVPAMGLQVGLRRSFVARSLVPLAAAS